MKYKKLGRTGLFVSEICLGTMTFGGRGELWTLIGQLDQAAANSLLRLSIDAGINFFDTADVYSEGESERILGRAIQDLGIPRSDVIIATKVRGRTGPGPNAVGLSRGHIMSAVKDSLTRLGTDYIDLYQIHGPDPVTPLCQALTAALRDALNAHQTELDNTYRQNRQAIEGSAVWTKLNETQRAAILREHGLETPATVQVSNDDDILATLSAAPLDTRRTAVEALSHRAAKAMEAAAKLLEPKAERVYLPSASIKNEAELDAWLAAVRDEVVEKLKDGPVIL